MGLRSRVGQAFPPGVSVWQGRPKGWPHAGVFNGAVVPGRCTATDRHSSRMSGSRSTPVWYTKKRPGSEGIMPLYEYRCRGCGETFEVLQRFSDPPLEEHQACGGVVERLISPSAFQFKGTGFYITDYAKGRDRKGRNGRDSKSESGEKPAESPAAKPPESKPASGADSASKA